MSRRNGEPGACRPAGGAAPTWRIRLGLGEREQSQGKLLIALKPAAGSGPSRGSCVTAVWATRDVGSRVLFQSW